MILVRHGRSLATRLRAAMSIIAATAARLRRRKRHAQQESKNSACRQSKLTILAQEFHPALLLNPEMKPVLNGSWVLRRLQAKSGEWNKSR